MAQMKRVPASQLKKSKEQMKSNSKVKITGTATTTPRVSASMIKAQPMTVSKPKRKGPSVSRRLPSAPSTGTRTPMPRTIGRGRNRRLLGGM